MPKLSEAAKKKIYSGQKDSIIDRLECVADSAALIDSGIRAGMLVHFTNAAGRDTLLKEHSLALHSVTHDEDLRVNIVDPGMKASTLASILEDERIERLEMGLRVAVAPRNAERGGIA